MEMIMTTGAVLTDTIIDNLPVIGLVVIALIAIFTLLWDSGHVTKRETEEDITREVRAMCERAGVKFFFTTNTTVDYSAYKYGDGWATQFSNLFEDMQKEGEHE